MDMCVEDVKERQVVNYYLLLLEALIKNPYAPNSPSIIDPIEKPTTFQLLKFYNIIVRCLICLVVVTIRIDGGI